MEQTRIVVAQRRRCGRRIAYILAALALVFISGTFGAGKVVAAAPKPFTGSPAPKFTGETLNGELFALDQLQGRIVLLNFWATWCQPCVAEMGEFQSYIEQSEQMGKVTKIAIVAVNVGEKPER